MRKLLSISVAALLALPLVACDETATTSLTEPAEASPSASQSASADVITEEAPLLNLVTFQVEGVVTLKRKPGNNTMSWQLKTSADRPPGNSFTVWIGNFDEGTGTDGGWGAGGLFGGNGEITASGNHCVWPLDTFFDGGFRPGDPPNCDKIDVEGPVTFFLLDHGEWESGDMLNRWDPTGTVGPDPFAAAWVASFLPL